MNGRNSVFFRPDSTALGQTYRWYKDGVLLEADIVIYDGSALFLPDWRACSSPQRYLHETAIHEFGHALGLGHSSVAEATMWPSVSACSTSLRTLAADDKAGIEALYKPSGTTTSVPAAPSGLAASATSSSSITVRWTDNASNETGFAIERATSGGTYAEIARVGTNVVSYGNSSLSAGTTSQLSREGIQQRRYLRLLQRGIGHHANNLYLVGIVHAVSRGPQGEGQSICGPQLAGQHGDAGGRLQKWDTRRLDCERRLLHGCSGREGKRNIQLQGMRGR